MASKKFRGQVAWLVTRHWVADYPKWELVAILSPRLGGIRVREYVELIYLASGYYTASEQLSMMWSRHGQAPYPAEFGQNKDLDRWLGEIFCGNDPYLRARLVDDLRVERDANGQERPVWMERPRGSSAWRHGGPASVPSHGLRRGLEDAGAKRRRDS